MSRPLPALVSVGEACAMLAIGGMVFIDASWHLPQTGCRARAECAAFYPPEAYFLDIYDLCAANSHMLPEAERFRAMARSMGLTNQSRVVVYDSSGSNFSAARVWWMFRTFVLERASVLEGGLVAWTTAGRIVTSTAVAAPRKQSGPTVLLQLLSVAGLATMLRVVGASFSPIVDARSQARIRGSDHEPRPGLRCERPAVPNHPPICLSQRPGRPAAVKRSVTRSVCRSRHRFDKASDRQLGLGRFSMRIGGGSGIPRMR